MIRRFRQGPLVFGTVITVLALSCSGSDHTLTGPAVTAPVARLSIAAPRDTLTVGDSVRLQTHAYDAAGSELPARTANWATNAPDIVTVSSVGEVFAVAPGTAVVTATVGSVSASATIVVMAPPVVALTLTPGTDTEFVGDSLRYVVTAVDALGHAAPGRHFTWQSSDTTIAIADDSGLVTGRRSGTTTITVSCDSATAHAVLIVKALPVVTLRVRGDSTTAGTAAIVSLPPGSLTDSVYVARFDTATSVARRIDDSTLAVLVPRTVSGPAVVVSLRLSNAEATTTIHVTPAPVIADPAATISAAIQTALALAATPAVNYEAGAWPADSAALAAAVTAASTRIASLSATDQLEAAQELAALNGESPAAQRLADRASRTIASTNCPDNVSTLVASVTLLDGDAQRSAAFSSDVRTVLAPTEIAHEIGVVAAASTIVADCTRLHDPVASVTEAADGSTVRVHAHAWSWIAPDAAQGATAGKVASTYVGANTAFARLAAFGTYRPASLALPGTPWFNAAVTVPAAEVVVSTVSAGGAPTTAGALNDTTMRIAATSSLATPTAYSAVLSIADQDFPATTLPIAGTLPATPPQPLVTLKRLLVIPTVVALQPDSTLTLVALGADTLLANVPEATFASEITWTSNAPGVASVDSTGAITARAAGTATITATVGNVHSSVPVTVQTFDVGASGQWAGTYALETFEGHPLPSSNPEGTTWWAQGGITLWPSGYYTLSVLQVTSPEMIYMSQLYDTGRWSVVDGNLTFNNYLINATEISQGTFTAAAFLLSRVARFRRISAAPAEPIPWFGFNNPPVYSATVTASGSGDSTVFHLTLAATDTDIVARVLHTPNRCPFFMISADSVDHHREVAPFKERPESCPDPGVAVDTISPGETKVFEADDVAERDLAPVSSGALPPGRYYVWILLSNYYDADGGIWVPGGWVTLN